MRFRAALLVTAATCSIAALLTACAAEQATTQAPPAAAAPAENVVFVTLGGDETLNRGLEDSFRTSWTQQLFVGALPPSATYVNVSRPGASVRNGVEQQLSLALDLKPTLATLWFGSGDLDEQTPDATFGQQLTQLVLGLKAGGVRQIILLSRTAPTAPGSRYAAVIQQVAGATGTTFVAVPGTSDKAVDPTIQTAIADAIKPKLTT